LPGERRPIPCLARLRFPQLVRAVRCLKHFDLFVIGDLA
jgi:hypothetical protein